jgi:hypothetical protein
MIAVGLDLATNSAAAYGRPGEVPRFQHWGLSGSRGERGLEFLHRFRTLLDELKGQGEPITVFIEAPIDVAGLKEKGGFGRDSVTLMMLNGLIFLAETVAASRKVPTQLIRRQDALKHFTGRSQYETTRRKRPPKNDMFADDAPINRRSPARENLAKLACQARCRQLRWPFRTPDEADAAAIWDTGCAMIRTNALLHRVIA